MPDSNTRPRRRSHDLPLPQIDRQATGSSSILSFTTAGIAPSITPVISGVAAQVVSSTSATITWTTDQPTTSLVNYGTSSGYGMSSTLETALVTSHSVTLTGLTAGTTYDFRVVSANADNVSATSANGTFAITKATLIPPNVGYVAFWAVTSSGVTISWSTDVPATTQIAYGTTASPGQLTPVKTALTASHGVVLTGLTRRIRLTTFWRSQRERTGRRGLRLLIRLLLGSRRSEGFCV